MNRTRLDSAISVILGWSTALILILVPFHAFFTTWLGSNFGHLDGWRVWSEVLLLILVPLAIYIAFKMPDLRKWLLGSWIVRLYLIYIALHLVLGLVALRRGDVNSSAFVYSLIVNLRFVGFFLIAFVATKQSPWLKARWREIVLIPAAVVVGFGVLQRFLLPIDFLKHFGYGPSTIPAYQTVDSSVSYHRIQSTLRGANPLGAYLIIIIPSVLVSLKKRPWLQVFGVAGAGLVLFFSYSRSAWIGTILAGIILIFGVSRARVRRYLIIAVLALGVVAVTLIAMLHSNPRLQDTLFHTSNSSTSAMSSNEVRASSMKQGLRDVEHQPLGRGPGTAGPASERNNQPPRISENYFLQLGQEVGVLGVVLFIVINLLVVKDLWAKRHELLAVVLVASWAGITVVDLLSHAWTDDTLSLLWWGLAGIALSPVILKKNKRNEKNTSTTP